MARYKFYIVLYCIYCILHLQHCRVNSET